MRIIIEQGNHTSKFASATSLVNALTFFGCECFIWNPKIKNIYDVVDEIQPSLMLINSQLTDKHINFLADKTIRLISISQMNFIPDAITYNPSLRNDNSIFCGTTVCIANFLDVDALKSKELADRLKGTNQFRLFTPANHFRSYGFLHGNFASEAVANADTVFAISSEFALQASLCCKNLIVGQKELTEEELNSVREEAIRTSNIFEAKKYLPIGTDWETKAKEFFKNAFRVEICDT